MEKLHLLPGPRLVHEVCTLARTSTGAIWSTRDVTKQTNEYLFKLVELGEGVTLADIFGLLTEDPVMQAVFRQYYVKELCDEVQKGAIRKDEQVEFLELYQHWGFDSHAKAFDSTGRYKLHGIGPVLTADVMQENYLVYKKGDRIQWGVSMTPVREMLHLPVRLKSIVSISEADLDARKYGQEVSLGTNRAITLGTLIREVLWELSWHGGPDESHQFSEALKDQVAEIEAGKVETTPGESLFESLGFLSDTSVHAKVFALSGPVKTSDLRNAIQNLDDVAPASLALLAGFNGTVMLKAEYSELSGRALRAVIRDIRYN